MRVGSQNRQDLTWLKEFLAPQSRSIRSMTFDCQISLRYDPDKYRMILQKGSHPSGRQVDCFALDTKTVRLPLWDSNEGEQIMHDPQFNVFYRVNRHGEQVLILALDDALWNGRIALMRVVREFAMNYATHRGGIILHGSSFLHRGQGIAVAGPKRSGKTTFLINILRNKSIKYVSNDRVLVSSTQKGPVLQRISTIVTLRPPMLRLFPEFKQRLTCSSYSPCLSLSEARKSLLGPISKDHEGRFSLSPAQLLELLDVVPASRGRLGVLLFPRITRQRGGMKLRRLSGQAALQKLTRSLFRAAFFNKRSNVFCLSGGGIGPDQISLNQFCRKLVSEVKCFDCELGEDAYRGSQPIERLLRQLQA